MGQEPELDFSLGVFRNKVLAGSVAVAVALQACVIYIPALQVSFHTYPLTWRDWLIVLSAGGSLFVVEETRKVLFSKLFSAGKWQPWRWRRSRSAS